MPAAREADFPPCVFPHEDWLAWAVGLLIVVPLLLRMTVIRLRGQGDAPSGE